MSLLFPPPPTPAFAGFSWNTWGLFASVRHASTRASRRFEQVLKCGRRPRIRCMHWRSRCGGSCQGYES
eukprot:8101587-Pyramimonas_sp.AAC.1